MIRQLLFLSAYKNREEKWIQVFPSGSIEELNDGSQTPWYEKSILTVNFNWL